LGSSRISLPLMKAGVVRLSANNAFSHCRSKGTLARHTGSTLSFGDSTPGAAEHQTPQSLDRKRGWNY
jgi:hypothetical protein